MEKQFRTGITQLSVSDNGEVKLSGNFGHPMALCEKVEIFEASSVKLELNCKGEVIRIFISGIIPKEAQ